MFTARTTRFVTSKQHVATQFLPGAKSHRSMDGKVSVGGSGQTKKVSVRFQPKYVSVSVFRLSSFSAFGFLAEIPFLGQNFG